MLRDSLRTGKENKTIAINYILLNLCKYMHFCIIIIWQTKGTNCIKLSSMHKIDLIRNHITENRLFNENLECFNVNLQDLYSIASFC